MAQEKKLGRNDPCHCGSGKKYKHCHMEQDKAQARREQLPPMPMPPGFPDSTAVGPTHPPPTPSQEGTPRRGRIRGRRDRDSTGDRRSECSREQFEVADLDKKVELFTVTLTTGKLDSEEAFEMLTSIREEMDTAHNPQSRIQYAELVGRLRDEAPELYQHDVPYYHSNLINDAITDMRWEAIPELLAFFAANPENGIDIFFRIMDALMYHGQIQPLIHVMGEAWQKVMDSDGITPWGINEFGGKLMSLIFFNYMDTAEMPRVDDAALRDAVAPYGGLNNEWLEKATRHLSGAIPISWKQEDFGESVDAEEWQDNVGCLLLDFMADQKKCNGVPFSRSEFARIFLSSLLYEQIAAPAGGQRQRRSSRGRRSTKRSSRSQSSTMYQLPLVPTYESLDKGLAEFFGFLNLFASLTDDFVLRQVYKASAVVELLPAYLHFLTRLNLIHPTEMDAALGTLSPVASSMITLLERTAGEPHLVEAIKTAWSDETLASLRDDTALAEARAKPLVKAVSKPQKPTRKPGALQTYTFKVTYEYDSPPPLEGPGVGREVWRKIEISEDQTLDDLHSAIIDSVDFSDDHLYSFFLSGKAWDNSTEYASPNADGRSAARVKIKNLRLRMKQKFLYIFDYGDEHRFEVQLTEINPDAPKNVRYPIVLEEHGEPPSQYGNWEDEEDEE